MDREALEELKTLCAELTPGPWQLAAQNEEGMICIPHPHWDLCTVEESPKNVACILTNGEVEQEPDADLRFMVAARTALPQLITEVERSQWQTIETASPLESVLIYYLNSAGMGRRIKARYVPRFTVEDCSDDGEWFEWGPNETGPYLPEGWYEQIDNWDDLAEVFVNEKPSHWMPLPPPPALQSGGSHGK